MDFRKCSNVLSRKMWVTKNGKMAGTKKMVQVDENSKYPCMWGIVNVHILLLLHLMNNNSIIDIHFNVAFILFTSITVPGIFHKNSWSWLLYFLSWKRWGQVRKGYMCIEILHRIFPLISQFPQEIRNHTRYSLYEWLKKSSIISKMLTN